METNLYTIHRKGERGVRFVGDGFDLLALLAWPIWLVWQGLWITAAGMILVLLAATTVTPFALLTISSGAGLIFALEGASFIRAELRLRGWRETGVVEARSEAGAEELFLTGQVA